MNARIQVLVATGCLLSLAFAGCGDDSTKVGGNDAGAAGVSGGTGGASAAGTGGTGGGGSTFDGKCGTVTCPALTLGTGCCTAEGTGKAGDPLELTGRAAGMCGTDIGMVVAALAGVCLQLQQPGVADSNCSAVSNGFSDEPGCCTDEGFCGTMSSTGGANLGCHYPQAGRGKACGDDAGAADAGN